MTQARTNRIASSDDTHIFVRDAGPKDAPPILFIHGWSMNHMIWDLQFDSGLADEYRLVAMDMRGHGMSDKPQSTDAYMDGGLWADDVAAIIKALSLHRPMLVGWSYAGLVIGDYLKKHHDAALSGIMLVAALMSVGQSRPPTAPISRSPFYTDDQRDMLPILCNFIDRCTARPVDRAQYARMVAGAALTRPKARQGMNMRRIDHAPTFAKTTCPVSVVFGAEDVLVSHDEAEAALTAMPRARFVDFPDIGHTPQLEVPELFNAELSDFARICFATQGGAPR